MVIALIISVLTALRLFGPGYFPMHDDLQVMRLYELEKCFADGQIPCRWVPDMNFGFGQAMFNFYSTLPYYLGVLIRIVLPISILTTVKILFAISLVGGALGMYSLSREFFGHRGAIIASALYALAPYRAVNVYVRGAMAESFSLAILPFLWLSIYKVIKEPNFKNSAFVALAVCALLMTHNISTFVYFGFTAVWTLFWLFQKCKTKNLRALIFSSVLGVALAGFFIVPVAIEQSLVQGELFISDYSNYTGHFTTLNQLFISRFWGYGGSIFGENDGMAFQVGWPHWWAAILVGISALSQLTRKNRQSIMVLGLLALSLFSLFMTHNKSTFLWETLPMIAFVQFPWRFLGIAVFLLSLASGGISNFPGKVFKKLLFIAVVITALVFNFAYFKHERTYDWLTDEIKLSGADLLVQQGAAAQDYLPATVGSPPLNTTLGKPVLVSGEAELPNLTKTSSTFFFDANVSRESEVDVPIIYFPNWEVYLLEGQGKRIDAAPSEIEGLIRISLPAGKHMVYGKFVSTPARILGNALSASAFFILIAGAVITNNKRKFLGLE